jgi:hypothetical protein
MTLKLDNINPKDRLESLEEIKQLAEYLFRDRKYMTFVEFKKVTETECSDLFITVNIKLVVGLFLVETEDSLLQASTSIRY